MECHAPPATRGSAKRIDDLLEKKRKRKGSEIREDADVAEIKGELRERGVDFENCLRRRRDSIRRGLILGEEFVMVEGGAMIVGSPGES